MNDLENYKTIVESIFGNGICTFSTSSNYTNKIIGALNSPTLYKTFVDNFVKRFQRLNEIYKIKTLKKNIFSISI